MLRSAIVAIINVTLVFFSFILVLILPLELVYRRDTKEF